MKFGLRNLILLVTLIAVLLGLFQNGNKMLGRHLLIATMVIGGAVVMGSIMRSWKKVRLWCAIGGLSGAINYGFIAFCLKDYFYRLPYYMVLFRNMPNGFGNALTQLWWREAVAITIASIFIGASIGPFLILVFKKHDLSEEEKTNRNITGVLLGLMALCYFLAVADQWYEDFLQSNWIRLFFAILVVFVLFTLPWVGKHFRVRADC